MAKRSENKGATVKGAGDGANSEKPTFESALSSLEETIDRLESDDLTLEESLAHFENGIRNIRLCEEHLKNVKGRLAELSAGEDGEFVTEVLGVLGDIEDN